MKLTVVNGAEALTMSSREIAELVGSRHDKVKQSIERLAARGVIDVPPLGEYLDSLGRPALEYRIDKRSSLIVVAQLCPEFTARVVDRWQELEAAAAKPQVPAVVLPDFNDPVAAARAWANSVEQERQATAKLLEVQPMVDGYSTFLDCKGNVGLRVAAKALGATKSTEFIEWLRKEGILFKDGRGKNQPVAHWLDAG